MSDDKLNRRDTRNIGSYIIGVTLGEGAFGKVKAATHIHTGEKVAIKILDKNKMQEEPEDIIRVQTEIALLKRMRHKNIIQLYEIMESTRNIYLVTEYCEGKELFDYIVMRGKLSEIEALKFFQEIIDALDYLHVQNIVHRDLKPENLLLDDKFSIKVSDFGLSRIYSNDNLLSTPCGTPSYAPPEMLKGEEYHGLLSDVWSSGIILYAMLSGYLPFSESNEEINCQKIIRGEYQIPDEVSELTADFLRGVLQTDPLDRFDIEQIKSHPWFNSNAPSLRPGIIIGHHNPPVDERILQMVEDYGYNKEKARISLINNKFDVMTSIYFLSLRKLIKEGGTSISDLRSEEYLNYINDENNIKRLMEDPAVCENKIGNNEEGERENMNKVIQDTNNRNFETVANEHPEIGINAEMNNNTELTENANHDSSTNLNEIQINDLNQIQANEFENDISIAKEAEIVKANDSFLIKYNLVNKHGENKNTSDKNSKANISLNQSNDDKNSDLNKSQRSFSSSENSKIKTEEVEDIKIEKKNSQLDPNLETNKEFNRKTIISKRLTLRMAEKPVIFKHDFLVGTPIMEYVNTIESNKKVFEFNNKPENGILKNFKRNSIILRDINLEKEKEIVLKSTNPRKSLVIEGNFRKNLMNIVLSKKQSERSISLHSIESKSMKSETNSQTDKSIPVNPINHEKPSVVVNPVKSNSIVNQKIQIDKTKSNITLKETIRKTDSINSYYSLYNAKKFNESNKKDVNANTSNIKTKTLNVIEIKKCPNNKNASKNMSKPTKNMKIIKSLIHENIQNNNTLKSPTEKISKNVNLNRINKFTCKVVPVKIDTSVERSVSKSPGRNLSYSPKVVMTQQLNRVQKIPWNLQKKIIESNKLNVKRKIIGEYEKFKKLKKEKILKPKMCIVNGRNDKTPFKTEPNLYQYTENDITPIKIKRNQIYKNSQSTLKSNHEDVHQYNYSRPSTAPFYKTENPNISSTLDLELNQNSPTNENFYCNTNINYSSNRIKDGILISTKNLCKKVFILKDDKLQYLKSHSGAIDFNCIVFRDISKIIEQISQFLKKRKIVYIQTNPYKFRCSKNGLSLDIEIFKLEHVEGAFYFTFKKHQGESNHFQNIAHLILSEMQSHSE